MAHVSDNISLHIHLFNLNQNKDCQKKENIIRDSKNFLEKKDVTVIKKKSLYKFIAPMSLRLPLLENVQTQFGLLA